jgi:hypothetical protein
LSIALAFVLVFAGLTDLSWSEDLPYRLALSERSVATGLGQGVQKLPLLSVSPSRGKTAALSTLRTNLFGPNGRDKNAQVIEAADRIRVISPELELVVHGDGSAGSFRDLAVDRTLIKQARPVGERMSAAMLESLGRAVILEKMKGVVVLGEKESLVAQRISYTTAIDAPKGGRSTKHVLSGAVLFGRTINGVAVVGRGSLISVAFSNDGKLLDFHYDWPIHKAANRTVNTLGAPAILDNVRSLAGAPRTIRSNASPAAEVSTPGRSGPLAIPLGGSGSVLTRLECGYFDPGIRKRGSGFALEPACVAHTVHRQVTGTSAVAVTDAQVLVVPASTESGLLDRLRPRSRAGAGAGAGAGANALRDPMQPTTEPSLPR